MIVVDTNVIAACLLPAGEHTDAARRLLEEDRSWLAPILWRSEFGNLLCSSIRHGRLDADQAHGLLVLAEELMAGGGYSLPSAPVIDLAAKSGCTFYDCEFVALARDLSIPLVTLDQALLRAFPTIAVSLGAYN